MRAELVAHELDVVAIDRVAERRERVRARVPLRRDVGVARRARVDIGELRARRAIADDRDQRRRHRSGRTGQPRSASRDELRRGGLRSGGRRRARGRSLMRAARDQPAEHDEHERLHARRLRRTTIPRSHAPPITASGVPSGEP